MNNLKKSITGKYRAADVDLLLLKVRNDYEECLREQRDRIMAMRDEIRDLKTQLKKFRESEQYIVGAIARAEETARMIVEKAEAEAIASAAKAKDDERRMKAAAAGCFSRLCELRDASGEIYRAVSKLVGEQEAIEKNACNVRPFVGVYEGMKNG